MPAAADSLAARIDYAVTELVAPATILLATGDRTAQAFVENCNPGAVPVERLAAALALSRSGLEPRQVLARLERAAAAEPPPRGETFPESTVRRFLEQGPPDAEQESQRQPKVA